MTTPTSHQPFSPVRQSLLPFTDICHVRDDITYISKVNYANFLRFDIDLDSSRSSTRKLIYCCLHFLFATNPASKEYKGMWQEETEH